VHVVAPPAIKPSPVSQPLLMPRRRVLLSLLAGAPLLGCAAPHQAADDAPVVELLDVQGAELEVQFAPGLTPPLRALALPWVRRCALAVSAYFGRFPLPQVELLLVGADGAGVQAGVSYAEPAPLLRLRLGRDTTAAQFAEDWILVHEMVHLAIPRVPRSQNWLHEGLATYVEAVARGRAGMLGAGTVWQAWKREMPHGLPHDGDRGLDHTPTWGRTYWGGALFALLADVEMRRRSSATRGLQHALQGVLAAGGDFRVAWPVTRILATADRSVAQTTLTELYEHMKDRAVHTDLPALWRDLGVGDAGLRDDAPLSEVRRAILM
jgi:hypothetical protein